MKTNKQKVVIKVTQEYGVVNINIAAPAACGKSTFARLLDIELSTEKYSLINMDNTDGVTFTHGKVIKGLQSLYNSIYVEVEGCIDIAARVASIIKASGLEIKYLVNYATSLNRTAVQHIIITTTNVVPQLIDEHLEVPEQVQYYNPNKDNVKPSIVGIADAQYSAVELFQLRRELWFNASSLGLHGVALTDYLQKSLDFITLGKLSNDQNKP